MSDFRVEADLLGTVWVPVSALYGAQTQRAVENFPLRNQPAIGHFPPLIHALVNIKQAAALTNTEIGAISRRQGKAIQAGAESVIRDRLYDEFPVHYLHGGGGTSANMNVNEVLANLGEEVLGGKRGQYEFLHPNDHVNLHQSTNDVYPTACHLAVIEQWHQLDLAFELLSAILQAKISEIGEQRRLSRTCLQDAVESTFGDFLGGYLALLKRNRAQLEARVMDLRAVSLGGTIIGRPADVPAGYYARIIENLTGVYTGVEIRRSNNLFDAAQNLDDLVAVSSRLEVFARSLIKIGKDVRLLGSGPEGGLGELLLPAVQPGSSIMPGKVNPVMPEFLIQACFRIVGNHQMAAMAVDHGELDLNVWESPVVFGVLESMDLLEGALIAFSQKCLAGTTAPDLPNSARAETLIARLTELSKSHGYSTINNLCKQANGDFSRIRALLNETGLDA